MAEPPVAGQARPPPEPPRRHGPGSRRPTCAGCARRSSCPGAARRRSRRSPSGPSWSATRERSSRPGYSRERDPKDHAEEVALARAAGDPLLAGATLYSSLEPCLARASRPRSCAELIIEAGIPRVVIAWLEPPLFAAGGGAGALRRAGVTVVEIPWLAGLARSVNAHLVGEESG